MIEDIVNTVYFYWITVYGISFLAIVGTAGLIYWVIGLFDGSQSEDD